MTRAGLLLFAPSLRFPLHVAVVAISRVPGGRPVYVKSIYITTCLKHLRASGVGKLTQASGTQRFFVPLPNPCLAAGSRAPHRAQKRGWREGGIAAQSVLSAAWLLPNTVTDCSSILSPHCLSLCLSRTGTCLGLTAVISA